MVKLIFFVPIDQKEIVKKALFAVGAGKIGEYDQCCFETEGIGQFRPLKNASPFIGEIEKIEKVIEVKVEMVLDRSKLSDVKKTLIDKHPYETPAYEFYELLDF